MQPPPLSPPVKDVERKDNDVCDTEWERGRRKVRPRRTREREDDKR